MSRTRSEQVGMEASPWQSVNDIVMGGFSAGRMIETSQGLRFEGRLSLENNGGFASVRRTFHHSLPTVTHVVLQVKGDGRSYQFRIRQDQRIDQPAWRQEFNTSGDWQKLGLPLSRFEAVFRGLRVDRAGPIIAANICQIGFMLADKKPGDFALEVRSIDFLDRDAH